VDSVDPQCGLRPKPFDDHPFRRRFESITHHPIIAGPGSKGSG
jgi:hypothetical protein